MSNINFLLQETKKYGIGMLVSRVKYKLTRSESSVTEIFQYWDRYYSKLSKAEIEQELNLLYFRNMQRYVNFDDPVSFTEKIQWLKLYDASEQKTRLADKYQVRNWICEQIGEKYLVPLLGVWENFDDIDFSKLPDRFVLKMNHGSGMNIVVKDKSQFDIKSAKKKFDAWIVRPFEAQGFEIHYRDIPKRIIAEAYIEELDGELYDYKFHCFNGKPLFIQCIGNRNLKLHTGNQNNYDLHWNKQDWIFEDYPEFGYDLPCPKRLSEMVEIASKLSEGFPYVRVDLYDLDQSVLFGEMTFTPGNGMYPYKGTWTREKDEYLGRMIPIDNSKRVLQ